MMTIGLSTSGGIELNDDQEGSRRNHDLILYTSNEVFSLKKAEFSPDQLVEILRHIEILPSHLASSQVCYGWLVVGGLKQHFVNARTVTAELTQQMRQLRKNMTHVDSGYERYVSLIEKLLRDEKIEGPVLWRSDAWMTAYCDLAKGFDEEEKENWRDVLKIAFAAKSSKPSKKFLKTIGGAIDKLGKAEFVRVMTKILQAIGSEGPMVQFGFMGFMDYDRTRLDKEFTNLLRALVWATAEMPKLTGPLGSAATACFEPVQNTGGRCTKVGAACVKSLSSIGSKKALNLIQSIRDKAEKKSILKAIDKATEK